MYSTQTAELGMTLPVVGSREPFSPTVLNANATLIDNQFNATTGHDHSGAHKGKPIPAAFGTPTLSPTHALLRWKIGKSAARRAKTSCSRWRTGPWLRTFPNFR